MKGHNDVPATQEKTYLKWYNKIGYGSGDVGGNVVYAFLSAFVMIYLTDAVGLNPGIIGTLIMASRLFDGVSDLFFGNLIDRTHTKMGKARPWMFWAYFGCAATLIATFAIPTNVGQTAQYAWFFIAYTLLNAVFFTANNIAFSALTALITKNGAERVQMGSIRFMFAFGTSMLIQTFTVAGVQQFGGGAEGWRTIAIIYAVIGLAVNSLSVFSVRELSREELADRPGAHHDPAELAEVEVTSFKEAAKLVVANKYYLPHHPTRVPPGADLHRDAQHGDLLHDVHPRRREPSRSLRVGDQRAVDHRSALHPVPREAVR